MRPVARCGVRAAAAAVSLPPSPLIIPPRGAVLVRPRAPPRRAQSRWFFGSLAGAPAEKTFTESRLVKYSPDHVFSVVADVAKYKEFVPFVTRSEIVSRKSPNEFNAVMGMGFQVFTDEYTSKVTLRKPVAVDAVGLDSATFSTLRTGWRFLPGPEPDSCMVRLTIVYGCSNPIKSAAIGALTQEMAERQIQAFEKRCGKVRSAGKEATSAPSPAKTAEKRPPSPPCTDEVAAAVDGPDALSPQAKLELGKVLGAFRKRARKEEVPSTPDFLAACAALGDDAIEGFAVLAADPVLAAAVHAAALQSHAVRGAPLPRRMASFTRVVYTMVASRSDDRANLLFELLDRDRDRRLLPSELRAEMHAHLQSVAQAIGAMHGNDSAVVSRIVGRAEEEIDATLAKIAAADSDSSGDIDPQEWAECWQQHPTLLELFSVTGMLRLVAWAQASQQPDQAKGTASSDLRNLLAGARALAERSGLRADECDRAWEASKRQ